MNRLLLLWCELISLLRFWFDIKRIFKANPYYLYKPITQFSVSSLRCAKTSSSYQNCHMVVQPHYSYHHILSPPPPLHVITLLPTDSTKPHQYQHLKQPPTLTYMYVFPLPPHWKPGMFYLSKTPTVRPIQNQGTDSLILS